MIMLAEKVTDPEDTAEIEREIAYMLHLRKKDEVWTYNRLGDVIKDINP